MPAVPSRFPRTPLWVRALVTVVVIGVPSWWLLQWHDRVVNEHRLAAIASQIAGRHVTVHCPGPIAGALSYEIVEGTVQFDANGRPADHTDLRAGPCSELDALAEGRRAGVLACVARVHWCGADEDRLATAVDVVTHESFHLAGFIDEAAAECHSLQTMAWTAEQLGVSPDVAQRLAVWEATHAYLQMPTQYRGPCTLPGQATSAEGR